MTSRRFTNPTGVSYLSVKIHGESGYMDDCLIHPPEIKNVFLLFREMIQFLMDENVKEFMHDIMVEEWDYLKEKTRWELVEGTQRDQRLPDMSTVKIVTIKSPIDSALQNFADGHGLKLDDLM